MEKRAVCLAIFVLGFVVSTLLTWWFIEAYGGYVSPQQMLLSGCIAGGKWAIQIGVGWLLLSEKKWAYFRELGLICGMGSVVLVPYLFIQGDWSFFLGSLIACVLVMGALISWRLPAIGLRKTWVGLWFLLLAVAVTLQLTVVFKVF